MTTKSDQPKPTTSPQFDKFKRLTERLMAVPKKELDDKHAEYERKRNSQKMKSQK